MPGMIFRFSLYGFLKNQRYFEPFLVLAFLDKGLDYATVGLLIGFGAICVNALEIPTGAIADVLGRRRSMIASFLAYIAAFVVFALATGAGWLFGAMFLFSIGEAFRTGTHKAIIFAWLNEQDRAGEKTTVYGYTRSWSKIGSAVSVVLAAGIVFWLHEYRWVFWLSIPPYVANIVNFLGYPKRLDGERKDISLTNIGQALWRGLRSAIRRGPIRRLLGEAMGFEGAYATAKVYLQPVVKSAALAIPVALSLTEDRQRTAVLVGAVYAVIYIAASIASRRSGALSRRAGSDERAARWLWWLNVAGYLLLAGGLALELVAKGPGLAVAIGAFIGLGILQNVWRPMLVSRVADHAPEEQLATVLSIESQTKSLFVAVAAPLIGWSVDALQAADWQPEFLPVAALGLVAALTALALTRRRKAEATDGG